MSKTENQPTDRPSASEYTQPLVIATLSGVAVFGYNYYSTADVTRALTVGGVAFLVLFWVVLRGNNIVKQRESKRLPPTDSN